MKKYQVLAALFFASFLIIACGLFASSASKDTTNDATDSTQSGSPSAQPVVKSPIPEEAVFPLNPNPIDVTATLETENAVTYKGGYNLTLKTESNNGVGYTLDLYKTTIYAEDENGELGIDFNSKITMTPVSSIEGLPFSQGYLAAAHLAPDGAILLRGADLTMEIPGEFDPSTLAGFAADGTGEDLHFYPATFVSFDGKTIATFNVKHFSLYGVAQVLQNEVVAQGKRPPVKLSSQVEQELAPLWDRPKYQKVLSGYYDKVLKPSMSDLTKVRCNDIAKVVADHNGWVFNVANSNVPTAFDNTIDLDRALLYERLKECIVVPCELCLDPQPGSKPDKENIKLMVELIPLAKELGIKLQLGDDVLNNWSLIYNKCAKTAGLPSQGEGIAADGSGGSQKATCP